MTAAAQFVAALIVMAIAAQALTSAAAALGIPSGLVAVLESWAVR